MPTTIAVVDREKNAWALWHSVLAVMKDPDFLAVSAFAAIGLAATIGLMVLLPLVQDLAALASLLG